MFVIIGPNDFDMPKLVVIIGKKSCLFENKKAISSNIRHKDFLTSSSVTDRLPPLDCEMGWTGELWSKTNLLNWQN